MDLTPPDSPGSSRPNPSGILWTKLHVPPVPAAHVERRRLMSRLVDESSRRLTLVSAPAGFGKSALLADACRGWHAAWLSLDELDNDAVRFWRHVAATLDGAIDSDGAAGAEGRIGGLVDQVIREGSEPLGEALATAVVDGLGPGHDAEVVLVLDDYHVIDAAEVHRSLRFLLDHGPVTLRVVVATRADPPLPLAKWRAEGSLTELRAADLRFTAEEAASLLRNVAGVDVGASAAKALGERTEGWAAGLQLAGLSLAGSDDADAFAENFSGSHRFVLDYLTEEVLDQQRAPVRHFLLSTSLLGRLSGSLCDAVTGRRDGQAMLEEIEQANLFLVPLDDVRGWWRYHHLFADLLRSRFRAEQPDHVVGDIHRRAARWHHRHGEVDDAITHAFAAGDPSWAAQLIERHADELLMRREGATLRRWFAELPRGFADSRRLLLAEARVALYGGQVDRAEHLLDQADELADDADSPYEPSRDPEVSPLASPDPMADLLRAFVAHLRGDADRSEALAAGVVADGAHDSTLGLIAHLHLATVPWLRGDAPAAEVLLAANVDSWRAAGEHERAAWSAFYLGDVQRERGKLDEALDTYRDVLTLDTERAGADAPAAGVAHVGIAQVAYLRGELETALGHARSGIERCRHFVDTRALGIGLATLAWIHQARNETSAAAAAMDEAARTNPEGQIVDLLDPVPAERVRLWIAQGELAEAERWARTRGIGAATPLHRPHEPAHVALARLLLAQGRPGEALGQLDQLASAAAGDGRLGRLVEIEVLRAAARDAVGDAAGAVEAIAVAVAVAGSQGAVQVFVDESDKVATLVATLAEHDAGETAAAHVVDKDFLERLNRLLQSRRLAPVAPASDRSPALVVPLTERELDVLGEMAAGKPNKQIAADLYVSLNTVKKHVTHIFDKLGVANRTAAVARARDLDLLD